MEVQFNNVTITVGGCDTPVEAYAHLCEVLDKVGFEYTTDAYQVDTEGPDGLTPERSTEYLFPGDQNGGLI